MTRFPKHMLHAAAFAALLGSFTYAGGLEAATSKAMPGITDRGPMPYQEGSPMDTNGNRMYESQSDYQPTVRQNYDTNYGYDSRTRGTYREGAWKGQQSQNIEARIATLHERLGITRNQEPMWRDVANAMRSNKEALNELSYGRYQNRMSMTAVDDLRSYAQMSQAHMEGLNRLIPVFETLYDTMSDNQKIRADKVFSRYEGHYRSKKIARK